MVSRGEKPKHGLGRRVKRAQPAVSKFRPNRESDHGGSKAWRDLVEKLDERGARSGRGLGQLSGGEIARHGGWMAR
jgi:hypothetical protein